MRFVNIGFGNMLSADKIIAVVSPDSAPIKRIVSEAKENNMVIDSTCGRKTRAVIVMDSDHVVLSALQPETLINRFKGEEILDGDEKNLD